MRNETLQMCTEIRAEISELKNCVKDHHARIAITEHELELE
jgi:PHD/YefM family antitoxin component YafN of YafNO toxin-antitoxin module